MADDEEELRRGEGNSFAKRLEQIQWRIFR